MENNLEIFFGRMNDPAASAWTKGVCGDEMEIYLDIDNDIITEAKYHTTGCESTKACAVALINNILGKNVKESLALPPLQIIKQLKNLDEEHHHCAILVSITFYKAIAEYILKI